LGKEGTAMRQILTIVFAFVLTAAARGEDPARAIIEKAIQAHGGAAPLDKYPAGRAKAKGTVVIRGTEFPFTAERLFQMPGKLRETFEVVSQNIQRPVTYVASGNSFAVFAGGLAQEMPQSQIQELRTAVYVQNLTRLTPLLSDKKIKLTDAGQKTVDGKQYAGVIVSTDGRKDVRLYFDPKTNLLAAVERSGYDDQGKAVEQLEIYGGYREANGLMYSTKTLVKQNGKRFIESETLEFKPLEKVDSREFQINPP
jgi:hypothetical protein